MSSLNLNNLYSQLTNRVTQAGNNVQGALSSGNTNDATALMNIQYQMAQWSTMVTLQSNTIKAVGDAMKSTVQNIH